MDNEASSNPYVKGLVAIIEDREKQLGLDQDEEKRKEYYLLLFRMFLFHLGKGHQHNAIGAMGKKIDSLKMKVHALFYDELLPMHDGYGLNGRNSSHNFAVLAKYAVAQVVKEYE